jgi:truncated hemoglobin YjbI
VCSTNQLRQTSIDCNINNDDDCNTATTTTNNNNDDDTRGLNRDNIINSNDTETSQIATDSNIAAQDEANKSNRRRPQANESERYRYVKGFLQAKIANPKLSSTKYLKTLEREEGIALIRRTFDRWLLKDPHIQELLPSISIKRKHGDVSNRYVEGFLQAKIANPKLSIREYLKTLEREEGITLNQRTFYNWVKKDPRILEVFPTKTIKRKFGDVSKRCVEGFLQAKIANPKLSSTKYLKTLEREEGITVSQATFSNWVQKAHLIQELFPTIPIK